MYEEYDIIRTDLWPTMTTEELQKQHEVLLSRMAGLGAIMGNLQNAMQYQSMYMSMQQACEHLSNMIANPPKQAPVHQSNPPRTVDTYYVTVKLLPRGAICFLGFCSRIHSLRLSVIGI